MSSAEATTHLGRLVGRKQPRIIAHRGFSRVAPENTLPAFELALAARADLVELDARASLDHRLVVIHDSELDRTTDAVAKWRRRHNRVEARSAGEIQALDAGSWFDKAFAGTPVPSLAEAVGLIRQGSMPLIERKAGDVAGYLEFLRENKLVGEVVVQSFDWEFLRALRAAEPRLVLGALGPARMLAGGRKPLGISRKLNAAWLKQIEKSGAQIAVWNRQISKTAIRRAHERGLAVWIYTVDNTRLARRLLAAGVDGLITNRPILIRKVARAQRGQAG